MATKPVPHLVVHLRNSLWRAEDKHRTITLAKTETEKNLVASERVATLGRMVSGIMHEINNPLDAINLSLFMLRQSATAEQQPYLDKAQKMLDQVVRISRNALQFTRRSEQMTLVSISELLKDVQELFEHRIKRDANCVTVTSDLTTNVVGYDCDLRQLFANIFRNALDAAGPRGTVTVRVHACEYGVRTVIADSGSGISPITRSKLGQPFFSTKGESGTGLGLWISKQIVLKHGGTMRVRNLGGNSTGAVFSIFIPLRAQAAQAA